VVVRWVGSRGWVDGELAEEFTGGGVDHAHVQVRDQEQGVGSGVGAADARGHPAVEGVLVGLASSHGQGTTSHGPLGQPRLAVPAEREPLRHLQQEGLVTAGNRGMVRVNHLTPVEVRELFRVRAASEGSQS
jgi:hypothetical protein